MMIRFKDDPDMYFWWDRWQPPLPWSREVEELSDRKFSFQDPIDYQSKGVGFVPTEYNLDLLKGHINRDENTLFVLHGFKNLGGVTIGEIAFLYCRNSCWVEPFDFKHIDYKDFEDGLPVAREATEGDHSALAWLMSLCSLNGLGYNDMVREIKDSYRYGVAF